MDEEFFKSEKTETLAKFIGKKVHTALKYTADTKICDAWLENGIVVNRTYVPAGIVSVGAELRDGKVIHDFQCRRVDNPSN